MSADDPARRMRRLAGMLARKGYGAGVAGRAIREELAAAQAELDDHDSLDPDSLDPDSLVQDSLDRVALDELDQLEDPE